MSLKKYEKKISILGAIWFEEASTVREIAEVTGIPKSTVNYTVKLLVKEGLLTQLVAEEKRKHGKIYLSTSGYALLIKSLT